MTSLFLAGAVGPLAALVGMFGGDFKLGGAKSRSLILVGVILFLVGLGLLGFGRYSS